MLLTLGHANAKTIKSDNAGLGYLTAIQYLAPHTVSGFNVCKHASNGCAKGCLNTAGRGKTNIVQQARINRTKLFFNNKSLYKRTLFEEIEQFVKRCNRLNEKPAIRLNGTSDLPWEDIFPDMFTDFNMVQFYDYTKYVNRMLNFVKGRLPENYHLTFSRSEVNNSDCLEILRKGGNVAVVFDSKQLPSKWNRFKVNNADSHDLRFLDPFGVQGLYAKGRAKKDTTGFVVKV
jgi:hypothetical protein